MLKDVVVEADEAVAKAKRTELWQRRRIAYLERLVNTDGLTGILNRRGFQSELRRVLATAERYGGCGVLLCMDLDGFKSINDIYGHAAGDEVLKKVACVLRENTRETDYIGRLGGDEFAVILTRIEWRDGLMLVGKIDRIINSSFSDWSGRRIALRSSLGFLPYGPDDNEYDILARVDDVMYETKRSRRSAADNTLSTS